MCFLNIDVLSLYTSIDHAQGHQTMMEYLRADHINETIPDYPGLDWMALLRVMNILLRSNFFNWNETPYHQLCRTAKGFPAVVVFANVFMFPVEKSQLANLIASSRPYARFIIGNLLFILDDPPAVTQVAARLNALNGPPSVQRISSLSRAHCVMINLDINANNDRLTTRLHFKRNRAKPSHYCIVHSLFIPSTSLKRRDER